MTLTDFLLARIAEDEAVAHDVRTRVTVGPPNGYGYVPRTARVLAECEAKRRIVEDADYVFDPPFGRLGNRFIRFILGPQVGHHLRILATVYADHPDYRDEWRP